MDLGISRQFRTDSRMEMVEPSRIDTPSPSQVVPEGRVGEEAQCRDDGLVEQARELLGNGPSSRQRTQHGWAQQVVQVGRAGGWIGRHELKAAGDQLDLGGSPMDRRSSRPAPGWVHLRLEGLTMVRAADRTPINDD
jgi:hypothetical protein